MKFTINVGTLNAILLGWARNGAAAAAGWLGTHGYISGDQTTQVAAALLALASASLTVVDKFVVTHKIATAQDTPAPLQGPTS